MKNSVGFWNLIAKRYSKQAIADPDAYQKKLDLTQKYFTPGSKVLEFGCGTGSTALIHSDRVESILAIDYSKKMIEIANSKKADQQIENVTFQKATVFDINQPPESFDVILGLNVLHLIPQWQETLKEACKLLKPGGAFITSTACLGDWSAPARLLMKVSGYLTPVPLAQFIKPDEIKDEMIKLGLKIVIADVPGKDKNVHFIVARKSDCPE